jgi:serine protease Do
MVHGLSVLGALMGTVVGAGGLAARSLDTPAPGSRAAAASGSPSVPPAAAPTESPRGDVITLNDGPKVVAPILKETSETVWADIGFTIVEIPRARIESIVRRETGEATTAIPSTELFRVATKLPERSPKDLARRFGEAVIMVSTPGGLGSGFIIHPDGFAITNAHVIQGETRIRATLFRQDVTDSGAKDLRREQIEDVEIIAVDQFNDLALIKLRPQEGRPFPFVYIHAEDDIAAGQEVFVIGAPLGLERTLSTGVVATTTRPIFGQVITQITAPVNPGNSGGPLFNTRGEIIGVINAKIPFGEGLGFAVPVRYLRDFIRNRDAFAYDKNNPNSGHQYFAPPQRTKFGRPDLLNDAGTPPAAR